MHSVPLYHVLRLTFETREAFDTKKISRELLRNLYESYAPIPQIDRFLSHAEKLFPVGNCGLASLVLRHRLGKGEIVHGLYQESPHTFVQIDEWIVDITADQYAGPCIYVGPFKYPWQLRKIGERDNVNV